MPQIRRNRHVDEEGELNTSIKGKKRAKKKGGLGKGRRKRRKNGEKILLLGIIPRSQTFQTTSV